MVFIVALWTDEHSELPLEIGEIKETPSSYGHQKGTQACQHDFSPTRPLSGFGGVLEL